MSALIAQKSVQSDTHARYISSYRVVPAVKVSTHSTIQRASLPRRSTEVLPTYNNNYSTSSTYQYPEMQRQAPQVLPAFQHYSVATNTRCRRCHNSLIKTRAILEAPD